MELNIKTHVGIGDIIHLKQLLDTVKNKYEKINITFSTEVIKQFKCDYDSYYDFVTKLFSLLFSESPYNLVDDLDAEGTSGISFSSQYNVRPQIPYLEKYFIEKKEEENYIVVLTKIRGIWSHTYESFKDEYLTILNDISKKHKILLLGEKVVGDNPEYCLLGGSKFIYSIYDDLVNNLENYTDLTVDEIGTSSPNYNNFIKDCNIMNRAKHVIGLSTGGNIAMAMSVSSIINYYGNSEGSFFYHMMDKKDDKFITDDLNLFFSKLRCLCK
jgi:hypothetical protein